MRIHTAYHDQEQWAEKAIAAGYSIHGPLCSLDKMERYMLATGEKEYTTGVWSLEHDDGWLHTDRHLSCLIPHCPICDPNGKLVR